MRQSTSRGAWIFVAVGPCAADSSHYDPSPFQTPRCSLISVQTGTLTHARRSPGSPLPNLSSKFEPDKTLQTSCHRHQITAHQLNLNINDPGADVEIHDVHRRACDHRRAPAVPVPRPPSCAFLLPTVLTFVKRTFIFIRRLRTQRSQTSTTRCR